jgi:hypothetical protein
LSYVWIIRALWRIRDDAHENAFPTFLDKENINFLFQYARLQNELDEHCRRYHLHGFTTNVQDFTYLDRIRSDFINRLKEERSIEGLPPISKIKEKD